MRNHQNKPNNSETTESEPNYSETTQNKPNYYGKTTQNKPIISETTHNKPNYAETTQNKQNYGKNTNYGKTTKTSQILGNHLARFGWNYWHLIIDTCHVMVNFVHFWAWIEQRNAVILIETFVLDLIKMKIKRLIKIHINEN